MKTGKSPGKDHNITSEVLRYGGEEIIRYLQTIFKMVLQYEAAPTQWKRAIIIPIPKKSSKNMSNFRGISLMSNAAKVFNRVILNRIYDEVSPRLRPFQAGFRRGKSCTEQIHILRRIIEQFHQKNIPTVMTFIDFKKAFDSVNREAMWKILRSYGIPVKIVNIIKCLYDGSSSVVRVDGILSKEFQVNTGVLQGDTLAPFLFIIVLDFILQKTPVAAGLQIKQDIRLPDLDFADDIVLLDQSVDEAKEHFKVVEETAKKVGLAINYDKTKLIITTLIIQLQKS